MTEQTPTEEPIRLRGAVPKKAHPRPDHEDGDDAVTRALVDAAQYEARNADEAERQAGRAQEEADRYQHELAKSREALRAINTEVERRRQAAAPIQVAPGQALHPRAVPTGLDPARLGVGG